MGLCSAAVLETANEISQLVAELEAATLPWLRFPCCTGRFHAVQQAASACKLPAMDQAISAGLPP